METRLTPKAPDTLMLARHLPTHDGNSWVDELDTALQSHGDVSEPMVVAAKTGPSTDEVLDTLTKQLSVTEVNQNDDAANKLTEVVKAFLAAAQGASTD